MNTIIAVTSITFGVTIIVYALVGELLTIGECQRTTKRLLRISLWLMLIGGGMLSHTIVILICCYIGWWIGWRSGSRFYHWMLKRIWLPAGDVAPFKR